MGCAEDRGKVPSTAELAAEADEALREHLDALADRARARHGPLSAARLEDFLVDPDCVRRPLRLVFEEGEAAPHQFAQPGPDPRGSGWVLWVRPALRERPHLLPLAVAYLIPVVNYGDAVATDAHCLRYAARLLDLGEDECWRRLCALADELGLLPERPPAPGA